MDGAWIAVLGTLAGVLAGGAVTVAVEWQRWRRTERSRWYEERRELHARFLAAAERMKETSQEVGFAHGVIENRRSTGMELEDWPARLETARTDLQKVERDLTMLSWEVELISEGQTRKAAESIAVAARMLSGTHYASFVGTDYDSEKAAHLRKRQDEFDAATTRFVQAARREIGLSK